MKIRNGFVSNSSSSSFVVKYRRNSWISPDEDRQTFLLTKEQLKSLKKYGFKYTVSSNPYFADTPVNLKPNLKSFDEKWDDVCLTHSVTCNQDDVILFLLDHKIPFVALCHYDQELVFWDGVSESFIELPNYVEEFSRKLGEPKGSKEKDLSEFEMTNVKKYRKIKIEEWLEKERSSNV